MYQVSTTFLIWVSYFSSSFCKVSGWVEPSPPWPISIRYSIGYHISSSRDMDRSIRPDKELGLRFLDDSNVMTRADGEPILEMSKTDSHTHREGRNRTTDCSGDTEAELVSNNYFASSTSSNLLAAGMQQHFFPCVE